MKDKKLEQFIKFQISSIKQAKKINKLLTDKVASNN